MTEDFASSSAADPWAFHVTRFRVRDARITAIPTEGSAIVEHRLSLIVEEGRYHSLHDGPDGKPAPSTLGYMCFVTIDSAAAPDS